MNSKIIGGILLIVGTSIGGGMLALPVSVATVGFVHATLFLVLCWLVMTAGAMLILEVNLQLPPGSNIISMAKSTLGLPGQLIAWVAYLLLLYTLLSAYISGGSDLLSASLSRFSITIPVSLLSILYTCIFSLIIYQGIKAVDYVNRGLMFGKLSVYLLLIAIIGPHIHMMNLKGGHAANVTGSLMVLIASFGFASIVPSLRDYFHDDVHSLRKVILFGSLIPLTCYILWIAVILGVVAHEGSNSLASLLESDHATSGLNALLNQTLNNSWISALFNFFTSVCMLTAFLGVSIGLFDFLADGLKMEKSGAEGTFILALTFLPPLIVVLLKPGIYLSALSYAGICCIILLLLLPAVMAWQSRKKIIDHGEIFLPGGNITLVILILTGIYLLSLAI